MADYTSSKITTACVAPATVTAGEIVDLDIGLKIDSSISSRGTCRILMDVRQDAGVWQTDNPEDPNFVTSTLTLPDGRTVDCHRTCEKIRTLDLYPRVPEFLTLCEIALPETPESAVLSISVKRWHTPERPIDSFRFWFVTDLNGSIDFEPTGYKTYRRFVSRDHSNSETPSYRLEYDTLMETMCETAIHVEGSYAPIPVINTRSVPGIYWGELHGMAFNQRPIDDFYEYAKNVTHLDFCSAVLFSYNTCVAKEWEEVKAAADRHLESGSFIPIVGFECGTPSDDSHRVAYFFNPADVPPIFCETRPPARDATLTDRFHPDTVKCDTIESYYRAVHGNGGFVGGHFHTLTYREELLAELWQKQDFTERYQIGKQNTNEEENIYEYLRNGMKMGFTGGSDTHDSMPGNPYPEPGCPRAAGFTGVHLDELTPGKSEHALRSRRTIATSGARIGIWFEYGDSRIGDIAHYTTDEPFMIRVNAPSTIERVEVLRNGRTFEVIEPADSRAEFVCQPQQVETGEDYYHVRVFQRDRHIAWSSPIWIQAD